MLIPEIATVYVDNEDEWKELMSFLREHDCYVGNMRTDPTGCNYWPHLTAIRIEGNKFWRGGLDTYREMGPGKYDADPAWWCVQAQKFMNMHYTASEPDSFPAGMLDDIL